MPRVLLVDDHDDVRRAMARALQRMGHEVTLAGDGHEALAAMEAGAHALLITDINMPGMDGIELIMEVNRRWPEVPIIAVSGGGLMPKELLLDNAALLGAVTTLPKPVAVEDLKAVVDRVLHLPSAEG